jgi:AcrR family transcriptional regulator
MQRSVFGQAGLLSLYPVRKRANKKRAAGISRDERCRRAILCCALDQVAKFGFRAVSVESIAQATGVAKTTIYRRWPNKAAIVMDGFMDRVHSGTLFNPGATILKSVRSQMRTMAKAFRGEDGAMIRSLLAEAQFDKELAAALRERWTLPRRRMALSVFKEAVRRGELRSDIDLEATIDLLYAPMYYRLQMGIAPITDAYIAVIFNMAMEGLTARTNID